jgi:hypothetical protein
MFGSQVAEVAAGVIFVYWVLSMACSSLKELVARILDMRASTLEAAIGNMLADPSIASKIFSNHLIAGSVEPGGKPSYISSRNFALALFDVLAPPNPAGARTLQDLTAGLKNIPNISVQSTLLGLLNSSQGDVDIARKRVENWYDDSMERVSGWYKRKAQLIIFVLGLALCVLLNGDTLMIMRELWNDQTLRSEVIDKAKADAGQKYANPTPDQIEATLRSVSVPPIGWNLSRHDPCSESADARGIPGCSSEWVWKVFGLLLTAFAVTLGAPFWFDLLNTIVNPRLAGSPPAPAPR